MINPASMKQALAEGAEKLKDLNMFEQVCAGEQRSTARSRRTTPARRPRAHLPGAMARRVAAVKLGGAPPARRSSPPAPRAPSKVRVCVRTQGNGALNLAASQQVLASYSPRASLIPAALDLTSSAYAWPFSAQPLYAFAQPVVFNATILNGIV